MADAKISALTALTGANLASTDEFVVVDKSDTTMDAAGTDKRMTATELATGVRLLGALRGVRVVRTSGTQSIPDATGTMVTFDSESYDTDAFHDTGSNTDRLTVPSGLGGYYHVIGTVSLASLGATKEMIVSLAKNGAELVETRTRIITGAAATNYSLTATAVLALVATDYVTVRVEHSNGSSRDINNGGCQLSMHRVGA